MKQSPRTLGAAARRAPPVRVVETNGPAAGLQCALARGAGRAIQAVIPGEWGRRFSTRAIAEFGRLFPRRNFATLRLETGAPFTFPLRDGFWGRLLITGSSHEPDVAEVLLRSCERGPTDVLDCGANRGYWGCFVSPLAAKVVCVEAASHLMPSLEANSSRQARPFTCLNCAVWLEDGIEVPILSHSRLHAGGGVENVTSLGRKAAISGWIRTRVAARTIDSIVRMYSLGESAVLVVKLDLEGAEPHAFRGARETIGSGRAVFLFEDHAGDASHASTKAAIEAGLQVFAFDAGELRPVREASDAGYYKAGIKAGGVNFVAVAPRGVGHERLRASWRIAPRANPSS